MFEAFTGITSEKFHARFKCEQDCLDYLFQVKWQHGYACRKCRHTKYIKGSKPTNLRCQKCKYDESVLSHTLFQDLRMPVHKAFIMLFRTGCKKKGMSSVELSTEVGVQQKTAWRFKLKVKNAMIEEDAQPAVAGKKTKGAHTPEPATAADPMEQASTTEITETREEHGSHDRQAFSGEQVQAANLPNVREEVAYYERQESGREKEAASNLPALREALAHYQQRQEPTTPNLPELREAFAHYQQRLEPGEGYEEVATLPEVSEPAASYKRQGSEREKTTEERKDIAKKDTKPADAPGKAGKKKKASTSSGLHLAMANDSRCPGYLIALVLWFRGTHHHCSPSYLQTYLDEYFYRLNRRHARRDIFHDLVCRFQNSSVKTYKNLRRREASVPN